MASPNVYTRRWFSTFLGRIDPAIVAREAAFLERQLPSPPARVLDLCCGPGRHLAPLAACGYRMTGLDRDAASLGVVAADACAAALVRGDMRDLPLAEASFDAVICMWQSFGQFDLEGNRSTLAEMARVLGGGGVLVLDLYHRQFYSVNTGSRTIERDGRRVHEQRTMHGHRLRVRLEYEDPDDIEDFDWQLYTPAELAECARSVGLELRCACSEFDERIPPSGDRMRMQLVFRMP